jgi:hypothetical protein
MNLSSLSHFSNFATTLRAALSQRAEALKKQLAALGSDYAEVGRIAIYRRKKQGSLKGRKVPNTGIRQGIRGRAC